MPPPPLEEDPELVENEQWEAAALAATVQAHLEHERERVAADQQRRMEERERQREVYARRRERQEKWRRRDELHAHRRQEELQERVRRASDATRGAGEAAAGGVGGRGLRHLPGVCGGVSGGKSWSSSCGRRRRPQN